MSVERNSNIDSIDAIDKDLLVPPTNLGELHKCNDLIKLFVKNATNLDLELQILNDCERYDSKIILDTYKFRKKIEKTNNGNYINTNQI